METSEGSVTDGVFQAFLNDLATAGVDKEVIERLRKTLLQERKYSDSALKRAIFGDAVPQ